MNKQHFISAAKMGAGGFLGSATIQLSFDSLAELSLMRALVVGLICAAIGFFWSMAASATNTSSENNTN